MPKLLQYYMGGFPLPRDFVVIVGKNELRQMKNIIIYLTLLDYTSVWFQTGAHQTGF